MKKIEKISVYSDGGARSNPGPAAIGIVICNEQGVILEDIKEFIGHCTNNEAEYRALTRALEKAAGHCRERVDCFLDSELVVKQLNGIYRIRAENLLPLVLEVRNRERMFRSVTYSHVSRSQGKMKRADKLVNECLDEKLNTV